MLRTDVTHERAALELLEGDHPQAEKATAHGVLAVMKATREVAAELSKIEDRLHIVAERLLTLAPRPLALIGGQYINPDAVAFVFDQNGVGMVQLVNGQNISFPDSTADEIVSVLSW